SGGTINYDLSSKSTSSGGTNDVIDAANLSLTSPTTLLINSVNLSLGNGVYPLLVSGTAISGGSSNLNLQFANLTTNGTRQMFSLVDTGTQVDLDVSGN